MDITSQFLECYSQIRSRRGDTSRPPQNILHRGKPRINDLQPFTLLASEIRAKISEAKRLLLQHRRDLTNVHLRHVSDADRDGVEEEMKEFIVNCSKEVDILKQSIAFSVSQDSEDMNTKKSSDQLRQHNEAIVTFLYERLQEITKFFEDQRAARFERALAEQAQLLSSRPARPVVREQVSNNDDLNHDEHASAWDKSSPIYLQLLQENHAVVNELECMVDQVRQAERQLQEISELSHLFTTKLLEQASQIDDILSMAVEAEESVKKGNKEMEEAIRHSVNFRVTVLLFLILASLTLLFVDWYQ